MWKKEQKGEAWMQIKWQWKCGDASVIYTT